MLGCIRCHGALDADGDCPICDASTAVDMVFRGPAVSLSHLTAYPLVYLGTPYTKYADGIDAAYQDAARLAAALLRAGVKVFSPITHSHPIAIHGAIDPLDHAIWLPFDRAMMDAAAAMVVGMLPGWGDSYGVQHEIDVFKAAGKPVYWLDPAEVSVSCL